MIKNLLSPKSRRSLLFASLLVGLYFIFGIQLFGIANPLADFASADDAMTASSLLYTPATDGSGEITLTATFLDTTTTPRLLRATYKYVAGPCVEYDGSAVSTTLSTDVDSYSASVGSFTTSTMSGGTLTNVSSSPSNTVTVTWLSKTDIPAGNGTYCVYINPGYQATDGIMASSTVIVDNVKPTTASNLTVNTTSTASAVLNLPSTTSTDTNFSSYKIYYKQGSSGVTVNDTLFSTSTTPGDTNFSNSNFNNAVTTTITGLATGTEYVFNIWAYDTYGNTSTAASELALLNLAETPATPDISEVSTSTLVLTNNIAGNGTTTETVYVICKTDNGATCAANGYLQSGDHTLGSSLSWGNYATWNGLDGVTVVGLTPSTTYQFISQAINGDGVGTAYSTASTATTTISAQPISPTISAITTSTLTLSWGDNTNPASVEYRISASGMTTTSTVVTSSVLLEGLTPNASYTIRVESKNFDGSYNTAVTTSLTYTSSTNPTSPVIVSSSTTSMVLQWNTNGSATSTVYEITGNNGFTTTYATSTDTGQTITTTVSGLTPNTLYTFNIASKNFQDNSYNTTSSFAANYTLANPAGTPTASSPATTTIALSLDTNSNSAATTYAIYNSTSGNYLNSAGAATTTAVFQTTSTWSGITATGLTANTSYQFTAVARNGDSVNAATSSASTAVYTLANPAGTPTASSPATTTIALSLNANSNPAATTYAIYNSTSGNYLNSAGAATTTAVFQTTSTWSGITATGLTANTSYQFTAVARNTDSVNAATSSASTAVYTLANPAGTPTASSPAITTIALSLDTNSNSAATTYAIYNSTSGNYLDSAGASTSTAVYQTTSTWSGITATGLTANTSYQFTAVARNADSVNAATSSASTAVYTLANIPSSVAASASGNTITVTFAGDATSYYVIDNSDATRYSDYTTTLTRDFSSLTCNTSYTFKVKGKNAADTETVYSSTASATTGACASSGGGAPSSVAPSLPTPAPSTPATVVSITLSLSTPTPVSISGASHTVTVSSASASQITLTIQSEPIKLTLAKGQGKDIDTNNDSVNDAKITYLGLVSGKPKVEIVNLTDPTETKAAVSINAGAYETSGPAVVVNLNGTNIDKIAISNDPSFVGASFILYTATVKWNLTTGNGTKTVYVKFRSKDGGTSMSSDTIVLNELGGSVTVTAQTPPTLATTYKFTKLLYVGSTGTAVKELQKLLQQLGYYTAKSITGKYDANTKAAVIRFQKAKNLKPYPGWVGSGTLKALNALTNVANPTTTTQATTYKFTKLLYVGSTGTAVKELQKLLQQLGYYTAKSITGKYDANTKAAVIRFQKAKNLKPYPGWVGSGTLKALNSL